MKPNHSRAFGSVGHVTNATTTTFVLAPGTGVLQNDPGDASFPGASSLKFKLDLLWDATAGGFGPLATGYGSVTVGVVVGDGGSARFLTQLSFTDPDTGRKLRPDWIEDASFRNPGSFTRTFTTGTR